MARESAVTKDNQNQQRESQLGCVRPHSACSTRSAGRQNGGRRGEGAGGCGGGGGGGVAATVVEERVGSYLVSNWSLAFC